MIIILFFLMIFSLGMLIISSANLGRIKLAQQTLDNLQHMHRMGMISETQAMVFLRELHNPLDITSILEVDRQLKEIYEEHKNTNR